MSGIKFSIGSMKESKTVRRLSQKESSSDDEPTEYKASKRSYEDSDSDSASKKVKSDSVKKNVHKGIKIQINPTKPTSEPEPIRSKVAAIFQNDDSESDEEEMPPEARMRMRNIGKDTPTSSGPNSFFKTRHGFTDRANYQQRLLQQQIEEISGDNDKNKKK